MSTLDSTTDPDTSTVPVNLAPPRRRRRRRGEPWSEFAFVTTWWAAIIGGIFLLLLAIRYGLEGSLWATPDMCQCEGG